MSKVRPSLSVKLKKLISVKPGLKKIPFVVINGVPYTLEEFVEIAPVIEGRRVFRVNPKRMVRATLWSLNPTGDIESMKLLVKELFKQRIDLFTLGGGKLTKFEIQRSIDEMDKIGRWLVKSYANYLRRKWEELYAQ